MKTLLLLASFILGTSAFAATNMDINIQAPVSQEVKAVQPRSADYYSFNFGFVRIYTTQYIRYTMTNTGTTPLTFRRALIGGIGFDAYHSCAGQLMPGQRCTFDISFTPQNEFGHSGRFILSFVEDLDIVVDLYGTGSRF